MPIVILAGVREAAPLRAPHPRCSALNLSFIRASAGSPPAASSSAIRARSSSALRCLLPQAPSVASTGSRSMPAAVSAVDADLDDHFGQSCCECGEPSAGRPKPESGSANSPDRRASSRWGPWQPRGAATGARPMDCFRPSRFSVRCCDEPPGFTERQTDQHAASVVGRLVYGRVKHRPSVRRLLHCDEPHLSLPTRTAVTVAVCTSRPCDQAHISPPRPGISTRR